MCNGKKKKRWGAEPKAGGAAKVAILRALQTSRHLPPVSYLVNSNALLSSDFCRIATCTQTSRCQERCHCDICSCCQATLGTCTLKPKTSRTWSGTTSVDFIAIVTHWNERTGNCDTIVVSVQMAHFTDAFLWGPTLECLVGYLPISTLRNLQLTCRQYAGLYSYALPIKWHIDSYLSRWLPDPQGFRRTLDQYCGIISGSAALHFLDQPSSSIWQPSDLDVYIHSHHIWKIHFYLTKKQSYVYHGFKSAGQARYALPEIYEVRTYSRIRPQTGSRVVIQLISLLPKDAVCRRNGCEGRCRDQCIETILKNFHSTAVLNYLTGTEAVSLFPQTTFHYKRRKTYPLRPYDRAAMERVVQKYVGRGWAVAEVVPRERKKLLHPLRKSRFVGDKLCWRMVFDGENGLSRKPSSYPPPLTSIWWTLEQQECRLFRCQVGGDDSDPYVWSTTKAHYYRISTHGSLRTRDLNLYRTLARLSAAHPAHRPFVGDTERPFYCDCNSTRRTELWSNECECSGSPPNSCPSHWSVESVGSETPYEVLVRMAEGEAGKVRCFPDIDEDERVSAFCHP